jgi:hypothetical protein
MMMLVNMFVDPFVVKHAMSVVEEKLLEAHAEENMSDDLRKAVDLFRYSNAENVAPKEVHRHCHEQHDNLI